MKLKPSPGQTHILRLHLHSCVAFPVGPGCGLSHVALIWSDVLGWVTLTDLPAWPGSLQVFQTFNGLSHPHLSMLSPDTYIVCLLSTSRFSPFAAQSSWLFPERLVAEVLAQHRKHGRSWVKINSLTDFNLADGFWKFPFDQYQFFCCNFSLSQESQVLKSGSG